MVYLMFIFGLVIGSFLNVCIYRIPRGESFTISRSHCPQCGHLLSWWELIPVVSFLILKGKCRDCGTRINWQYTFIEILTGIIFIVLFLSFGLTSSFYIYTILMCLLVVSSGIDINFRVIPDVVTVPAIVIGFILSIFFPHIGYIDSLLGIIAIGGSFYLINYLIGGEMGKGDIKMIAVVGAFTGWQVTLMAIFLGAFMGAINSFFLLLKHKNKEKEEKQDINFSSRLPFGPFLILGVLVSILYFDIIIKFYVNYIF